MVVGPPPGGWLTWVAQYGPVAGRAADAGSAAPAVENLLLAARAHGLAACLTSWHLFAEDEFKAVIGIPKEVQTWAIIPIGWPLRRFGPVNRRPVDELIHRERW
jgi:nitroreductase